MYTRVFQKRHFEKNKTSTPARNWGVPRKFISRRKCWSHKSRGLAKWLKVWQTRRRRRDDRNALTVASRSRRRRDRYGFLLEWSWNCTFFQNRRWGDGDGGDGDRGPGAEGGERQGPEKLLWGRQRKFGEELKQNGKFQQPWTQHCPPWHSQDMNFNVSGPRVAEIPPRVKRTVFLSIKCFCFFNIVRCFVSLSFVYRENKIGKGCWKLVSIGRGEGIAMKIFEERGET